MLNSHCRRCGFKFGTNLDLETETACRSCADPREGDPTLEEFFFLLKHHDWTYQRADSGSAYSRGMAERDRIVDCCDLSPEHRQMFLAFINQQREGNSRPALEQILPQAADT